MDGKTYSVRAWIKIQCPQEWDARLGTIRVARMYGFDTANRDGPGGALLSLHMQKSLHEPCGRFTMTFAPEEVVPGYYWPDLIPSWSLCEIFIQRYPDDPQPVLRMVGLTNPRGRTEDYSKREPERTLQISGQELSCIFVEQKILYLPYPPEGLTPDIAETILPASAVAQANTPQGPQQPGMPVTASLNIALLGMLGIDPKLALIGESPADAIDHFVKMVTTGLKTDYNPKALPLLNFQLPDAELKNLVYFDLAKAQAALFDPRAVLPAAPMLSFNSSLWNLMSTWSDPEYQELFAVSRDLRNATLSGSPGTALAHSMSSPSAVEIVFRKKPFAGHIDKDGKLQGVAKGVGTQFDDAFVSDSANTVPISGVLSESLFQSAERVSNIYLVVPQMPGVNDDKTFEAYAVPLLDNDPTSPSRIQRYGPRLKRVEDYYMRLGGDPEERRTFPDAKAIGRERQRLLRAWYRMEPLFYRGRITQRGNTRMQVGMRSVDQRPDGKREYYIEGWSDSVTCGQDVTYTQTLDVSRGWNLVG